MAWVSLNLSRRTITSIALVIACAACGDDDDDSDAVASQSVSEPPTSISVDTSDPPGSTPPPQTDPSSATDAPPATDPPQTDPPQTDPPQTDPPQTDPPQTDPPSASDASGGACFDCLDDERPPGVAAQLNAFNGGASGPDCSIGLEEVLGLSFSDPYVGLWQSSPRALGTHSWFCLTGFNTDAPVNIVIGFPDGSTQSVQWIATNEGGTRVLRLDPSAADTTVTTDRYDLILPLEAWYPVGSYTVDGQQGETSTTSSFEISTANAPSIQTSPPARYFGETLSGSNFEAGETVSFLFAGFAPNSTVTPLLYRYYEQSPCGLAWCFSTELPPFDVDEHGVGTYPLHTPAAAPDGPYCVTSVEHMSCDSQHGFSGEFTLGPTFSY